ncbi:MAG: bifunctional aspartate kinase/homoserine dehydrogenase I, partial [archaeon]
YGYRCSVMAGAEAVDKMKDLRDAGDLPYKIEGCFSGTLGYICSALEAGVPFSKIVEQARKLGYTEPHPREDLSGEDVARKILILARTAGYRIEYSDIKRKPFIPNKFLDEKDANVFMKNLKELDEYFVNEVRDARKEGKVLRYVARFEMKDCPIIRVGLERVLRESPLGMLSGAANKIIIHTKDYGRTPSIIEAPGAGLDITARNIRVDLAHQVENRTLARY